MISCSTSQIRHTQDERQHWIQISFSQVNAQWSPVEQWSQTLACVPMFKSSIKKIILNNQPLNRVTAVFVLTLCFPSTWSPAVEMFDMWSPSISCLFVFLTFGSDITDDIIGTNMKIIFLFFFYRNCNLLVKSKYLIILIKPFKLPIKYIAINWFKQRHELKRSHVRRFCSFLRIYWSVFSVFSHTWPMVSSLSKKIKK